MLRLPTRKAKIFRLFLLSYLLVFLLPFIAGVVFSSRILSALREQAIESRQIQLDRGREELEKRLTDLDAQAVQLAVRPKVATILLAGGPVQESFIYRVREAWLDLSAATFPGDFVESYFVYFRQNGILISREAAYVRLALFDTSLFSYNGGGFLSWQSTAGAAGTGTHFLPAAPVTFGEKKVSALTYVRPLPLGERDSSRGSLLVFVREDALLKTILPAAEAECCAYVLDASGRILASSSMGGAAADLPRDFSGPAGHLQRKLGGVNMIFFHSAIPARNWTLVSVSPEQGIMQKAMRLRRLISAVSLLLLVLGGGGACALAYWSSKPTRDIVRRLRGSVETEPGGEANEYELLDGLVNRLIGRNRDLGETLQRQLPFLRRAFFGKLYTGGFATREEADLLRALGEVDLSSRWHCVLLVQVAGYDGAGTKGAMEAIHLSRVLIKEAFESRLGCAGRLSEVESDTIALLVGSGSADREDCLREAEGIASRMGDCARVELGVLVSIAGGGPVEDPLALDRSYQEARHALGQPWARAATGAVLWGQGLPPADSDYWYPIDLESRIMNLTRTGSLKEIVGLLDRVYRQNFDERALSDDMRRALYAEMRGTIIKLTGQLSHRAAAAPAATPASAQTPLAAVAREIDVQAQADADPVEVFAAFRRGYEELCATLVDQKKSHNQTLKQSILAHIDSSYRDPGLCLRSVADLFGFNEIYLSQFFKEQTGQNFHRYLENLRLAKAFTLLKRADLSVNEVAREVGYASPGTFRKALRRSEGVSPTELRQRDKPGAGSLSSANS